MQRLGVDIRPHVNGRTVLDGDFTLSNLVFNHNYLLLMCLVRLELENLAILGEEDSRLVILHEDVVCHFIALWLLLHRSYA